MKQNWMPLFATARIVFLTILLAGCCGPKKKTAQHPPGRVPPVRIVEMNVSWDVVRRQPAKVAVLGMKPVMLVEGQGRDAWARVPARLTEYEGKICQPTTPVDGVADFKVLESGYAIVACNFSYQGNSSGDWLNQRWTRKEFFENGWREISAQKLGGTLVKGDNREQVLFVKRLAQGETGRLRCNKYDPPYFITLSSVATK